MELSTPINADDPHSDTGACRRKGAFPLLAPISASAPAMTEKPASVRRVGSMRAAVVDRAIPGKAAPAVGPVHLRPEIGDNAPGRRVFSFSNATAQDQARGR